MYSPRINALRIQAAQTKFQERFPKHELTYHSVPEVEEWNAHLKKLKGKDGRFKRNLTSEEARWIANEVTLAKLDHLYALTHYCFISDLDDRIRLFTPNLAQRIILDILADMEDRGVEIVLQFLKARRLGVSTVFELLIALRLMFERNIGAVIAAATPSTSSKMSRMALLAIERFPAWMRPLCTYLGDGIGNYKQGVFFEFHFGTDIESARNRLDLEHGTQSADIGRSYGPRAVHLSELAKFDNPGESIDAGLMKAMIPSSRNLCCLEGTSEGPVGWWPEKYEYNKKNWPGVARMRPTFLPWFVGIEIYPREVDLLAKGWYQVRDTWQPDPKTIEHAKAAQEQVKSDPLLTKHLGENWEMSREQMFFFESDIAEYRKTGKLHLWRREMAPDDRSCWASGEKSVFDPDLTMKYRETALAIHPEVFGLRCKQGKKDEVPKRYQPIGIDHKRKHLNFIADWTHKIAPFEFELYPLRFGGWNGFDETGKILIYEWPRHGETYSMSADPSDGKGEDSSVIKVMRKGGRGRCDAEVASFSSSGLSGTELWPWTLALGTLYSVRRDGKIKQPLFIPETNRDGGNQLLREMYYRGWKSEAVYCEYRSKSTARGRAARVEGFHTSPANRPDLVQRGIQALANEMIEVNSPSVVDEMDVFIRHANGDIKAAKNRHDDHLLALFLCFHALYSSEVRSTGADPFIERTRAVPEEQLYPLATNEMASDVSLYLDNMVKGNFEWPTG